MTARLLRTAGIVHADLLIRFRRTSTLVVFLLLSALAYVWVPDPATGRALIQIDGRRAIYNSATVGVGTASLGSLFLGLVGFYVISNAIGRDAQTRCGQVIASTPMRTSEYLFAKALGNIAFLVTFVSGYMFTAMAMLLVRAEAPLEPLVFVKQYLILLPPIVMFVSCVAVLFEAVPWLAGRLGDVVYFFLFMSTFGAAAATGSTGASGFVVRSLDLSGMALLLSHLRSFGKSNSMSIGSSRFDPSVPPIVYPGLEVPPEWIGPRLVSTFAPLAFVLLAALFFHRFDPARMKRSSIPSERGWLRRINSLLKPFTRPLTVVSSLPWHRPRLVRAAIDDALMTAAANPLLFLAAIGLSIYALLSPADRLPQLLVIAFVPAALLTADMSSREQQSGTEPMVYASRSLRTGFAWWKSGAAFVAISFFTVVPVVRLAVSSVQHALAVVAAMLLLSAVSTFLGIASRNPKTFAALFLIFWYVVVNDRGATPPLDIASLFSAPSATRMLATATAAVLLTITAHLAHHWRLSRS